MLVNPVDANCRKQGLNGRKRMLNGFAGDGKYIDKKKTASPLRQPEKIFI